jgi:hypothetical protein
VRQNWRLASSHIAGDAGRFVDHAFNEVRGRQRDVEFEVYAVLEAFKLVAQVVYTSDRPVAYFSTILDGSSQPLHDDIDAMAIGGWLQHLLRRLSRGELEEGNFLQRLPQWQERSSFPAKRQACKLGRESRSMGRGTRMASGTARISKRAAPVLPTTQTKKAHLSVSLSR